LGGVVVSLGAKLSAPTTVTFRLEASSS